MPKMAKWIKRHQHSLTWRRYTQTKTPQTCCKLSILPACRNLSISCNEFVNLINLQLVICRLVTTCWNKLRQSCWNNQLTTSLLTTCNKPVDKLQQTCCNKQPVASHANASWYRLVTSCCKMSTDLLELARFWLCRRWSYFSIPQY